MKGLWPGSSAQSNPYITYINIFIYIEINFTPFQAEGTILCDGWHASAMDDESVAWGATELV
jgi:hypothetical protein